MTRDRGHTTYGAHTLFDDNRHKQAYRAEARARMRCAHESRTLMADGNAFWCAGCQRIAGFVRLPTKRE